LPASAFHAFEIAAVAKLLEIQIPFIVANQGAYPLNDPVRDAQTGEARGGRRA
jgi:hypothetical protein